MADALLFITWENGSFDWVQKQHIEPLYKEGDVFAWKYDLDWQGYVINYNGKDLEFQWTAPTSI